MSLDYSSTTECRIVNPRGLASEVVVFSWVLVPFIDYDWWISWFSLVDGILIVYKIYPWEE